MLCVLFYKPLNFILRELLMKASFNPVLCINDKCNEYHNSIRYFMGFVPLLKSRTLPYFLLLKVANNPSYHKSDALYVIYLKCIYYVTDLKINFRNN